jgi:hypothetical protein
MGLLQYTPLFYAAFAPLLGGFGNGKEMAPVEDAPLGSASK